jgi:hypothetical protein
MWRCARRARVTDGNSGEQRGNEQDLPEHLLFVPVPRALRKGRSPGPAFGNVTRRSRPRSQRLCHVAW